MKLKTKKRLSIIVGLLLLVIVMGSGKWLGDNYGMLFNQYTEHVAQNKAKHDKPKTVKEMKQAIKDKEVAKPDYSGISSNLSQKQIAKLANSSKAESLRGYVSVPSYNINQPIYEGTSEHALALGVGTVQRNIKMGQAYLVLLGHNMGDSKTYPTKFSAMQNMSKASVIGKSIIVTVGKQQYTYKITNFERGVPVQTFNLSIATNEHKQMAKPTIQLVACDEDAEFMAHLKASNYTDFTCNKRLILTGELQ